MKIKRCKDCDHYTDPVRPELMSYLARSAKTAVKSQGYCLAGIKAKKTGYNDPACAAYFVQKTEKKSYLFIYALWVLCVAALIASFFL